MAKTHRHTRRVEFRDTDAAGIVHFSVFFTYMEQAEHDWWRSLGTSVVHQTSETKISWPRVAADCDYQKAIRFEEIVDVELQVAKLGVKSLKNSYRILRDEEVIATGSLTTVCCLVEADRSLKAIEIPADIRKIIEPFVVE